MFSVGVRRSLNAVHYLCARDGSERDFGPEGTPHSHPYEVELIASSAELDPNGFSLDIAVVESVLEETLARVDGVLLNSLPFFTNRQPSLENLAVFLLETIRRTLQERGAAPALPMELRIWENDAAWASYAEPVGTEVAAE